MIAYLCQVGAVAIILSGFGFVMFELGIRTGFRNGCGRERSFNYRSRLRAARYRDRRQNVGLWGDN